MTSPVKTIKCIEKRMSCQRNLEYVVYLGITFPDSIYMIPVYRQQDEQKTIREDAQSSSMKNLVALLCMVSALVGSVISSQCYFCESRNSTICNASKTECLGDECMTVSQHVTLNGSVCNAIYKGCANKTLCGPDGELVVGNTTYLFSGRCCTGDLCNTQEYESPTENKTLNGVKCLSCLRFDTLEECKTDVVMNCTGSMTRCLDYRATMMNPDGTFLNYSAKGCINSAACQQNLDSKIAFEEEHREYLQC
ncbi:phospholipase A2 inhibitor and Ly6/PLAUR domain-containing protein-like isoform 1-T1 [Anomaloglossus baeobatrachus]|uniref:phospholipase A2 inhibitor and Ly6/PLAUR domain-containing protein-like isoform X1 n=1 Tax=Anomaloglossus baeobatrachus TaxID=238106 RepID=UPI003F4F8A65